MCVYGCSFVIELRFGFDCGLVILNCGIWGNGGIIGRENMYGVLFLLGVLFVFIILFIF